MKSDSRYLELLTYHYSDYVFWSTIQGGILLLKRKQFVFVLSFSTFQMIIAKHCSVHGQYRAPICIVTFGHGKLKLSIELYIDCIFSSRSSPLAGCSLWKKEEAFLGHWRGRGGRFRGRRRRRVHRAHFQG